MAAVDPGASSISVTGNDQKSHTSCLTNTFQFVSDLSRFEKLRRCMAPLDLDPRNANKYSTKCEDGTIFLGDGSLAGAPTPKLGQKGIRSVVKVVDDKCLYVSLLCDHDHKLI